MSSETRNDGHTDIFGSIEELRLRLTEKEEELRLREEAVAAMEKALRDKGDGIVPAEPEVKVMPECKEEPEAPEAGLSEVVAEIAGLRDAIELNSHKDTIIRELHDEVQRLSRNSLTQLSKPYLKSLMQVHARINSTLCSIREGKFNVLTEGLEGEIHGAATVGRIVSALAADVLSIEDLLEDEYDAVVFAPSPGDAYKPKEHKALKSIDTQDEALASTIERCITPGFKNAEGIVVSPAVVYVYKLESK